LAGLWIFNHALVSPGYITEGKIMEANSFSEYGFCGYVNLETVNKTV